MQEIRKKLLEILQFDFPISVEPWRDIGDKLGMSPGEVLKLVREMKENGIIRRIGGIINKEKVGYRSTLIAVKAGAECLDGVAEYLNSLVAVTHNYLRDDEWNLWFTFNYVDESEVEDLIEKLSTFPCVEDIMNLPSERMVKIDARFR